MTRLCPVVSGMAAARSGGTVSQGACPSSAWAEVAAQMPALLCKNSTCSADTLVKMPPPHFLFNSHLSVDFS